MIACNFIKSVAIISSDAVYITTEDWIGLIAEFGNLYPWGKSWKTLVLTNLHKQSF